MSRSPVQLARDSLEDVDVLAILHHDGNSSSSSFNNMPYTSQTSHEWKPRSRRKSSLNSQTRLTRASMDADVSIVDSTDDNLYRYELPAFDDAAFETHPSKTDDSDSSTTVKAKERSQRNVIRSTSLTSMPNKRGNACLEDFEMKGLLGRGGFGSVYEVVERATGQVFAMKSIPLKTLEKSHSTEPYAEQRILAAIEHPVLVKLHCWFEQANNLHLVTELVRGGELFYHIRQRQCLSEELSRFFIAEIVCGLDYLHRHNIIYRDLKPENLLVTTHGHVKLTDFGLAQAGVPQKEAKNSQLVHKTVSGTPQYLAPEVLKGDPPTFAADWWSVGILAHEMLVGQVPFMAATFARLVEQTLQGQVSFPSHVSATARSFIRALLVRSPGDRLGCGLLRVSEIKNHKFFKGIDWRAVNAGILPPPLNLYAVNTNKSLSRADQILETPDTKTQPNMRQRASSLSSTVNASSGDRIARTRLSSRDYSGQSHNKPDLSSPNSDTTALDMILSDIGNDFERRLA